MALLSHIQSLFRRKAPAHYVERESPKVHIEFSGATSRFLLFDENGDSERIALTRTGPGLYRLDETSFLIEVRYSDTIRASELENGDLVFIEVVDRSPLITREWCFSKAIIESEQMRAILGQVMQSGGMWEQAFGGFLIIHLPPESAQSLFGQIESL